MCSISLLLSHTQHTSDLELHFVISTPIISTPRIETHSISLSTCVLHTDSELLFTASLAPEHPVNWTMAVTGYLQDSICVSEDPSTPSDHSKIALEPSILPTPNSTKLIHCGVTACLPDDSPTVFDSLTAVNFAYVDATYTTSPHIHPKPHRTRPIEGGQVVTYWYCCECKNGPFDAKLYTECVWCNDHARCSCCPQEQRRV